MYRFEIARSAEAIGLRDDIHELVRSKYLKASARDLIAGMAQFLVISCVAVGVRREVFLEYLGAVWDHAEVSQNSPVAKA